MITVRLADADDAAVVHALTQAAFAGQELTPPSGALSETEEVVRDHLSAHKGAIAFADGVPVGALRVIDQDGHPHVRRVSVHPAYQGRGVCSALMRFIEAVMREHGHAELRVGVRDQLPDNRAIYEHFGYTVVADHEFWFELRKEL